jgi:hypothetical protein
MDGAMLARIRWRRRGAWLWPTFVVATVADAMIGHALPPAGESQTVIGAGLVACFANLLGVLLLSRPLGAVARRRRPDFPTIVARDYGGTTAVFAITALILITGLLHRPSIEAHQRAMQEAIARAQAWIGDRAPAEFRRNLDQVSTVVIEPGSVYRTCVPSDSRARDYCVVVKVQQPLKRSVTFDGYESNTVFGAGVG